MAPGALREFFDTMPADLWSERALGDGAGVTVAIVDSGVEGAHPDIGDRLVESVEARTGPRGVEMVSAAPDDPVGHGTACAGVVLSLAPKADIVSVRALGPGCRGDHRSLLAALSWAIERGVDVINLSLGTRDPVLAEPLRELVARAYRRGSLVVAAANNVPGVRSYPAVFTSLLCVEAEFIEDREQFFFRFGEPSELVAPGVYVEAAWPGGGNKLVTGTSFACPHISGHVARIASANQGLKPFQVRTALFAMGMRHSELAQRAPESADD